MLKPVVVSLVTGPTSGIGRAFADALAREGHDLVLVSRDAERLAAVAAELQERHRISCEVLCADLSDLDQTRLVERRLRREAFAVVVNNAGYGLNEAFETSDIETQQAAMDVMVRAVLRVSHAAVASMLEAGRGAVVNVSSVAGYLPEWAVRRPQSLGDELPACGRASTIAPAACGFWRCVRGSCTPSSTSAWAQTPTRSRVGCG